VIPSLRCEAPGGAGNGKETQKEREARFNLIGAAILRGEVKKLVRDRAAVADQGMKAKLKSAPGRPKKLPKRTGAGKKPDRDVAQSKPVLPQAPQVPQPANRTASHVLLPPQAQTGAHGSTPAQSPRKPR